MALGFLTDGLSNTVSYFHKRNSYRRSHCSYFLLANSLIAVLGKVNYCHWLIASYFEPVAKIKE